VHIFSKVKIKIRFLKIIFFPLVLIQSGIFFVYPSSTLPAEVDSLFGYRKSMK